MSTRLRAGILQEGIVQSPPLSPVSHSDFRGIPPTNLPRTSTRGVRYGRNSIPTMEQRERERELERLERRAKEESAERDKENRHFVHARRTARTSSQSESPEHRHGQEAALAAGGGGDIYERTTEYVRRRESR